ncbi:arginase family protein [Agrococcus sp. Marseille-Q4369]|uniref:arginase family protein n=1 Tax=Agrococcus sp. Marseille-Q4369 TaxID=2810513 RepID=UPI001B8D4BB1|nr:arginase family protein [Agrococcus sp. Marseille-Q4369]QUW17661.1 arginase family protein [Agrococcus sp. Marseille-Q4369]
MTDAALPHDPSWPRAGDWPALGSADGPLDAVLVGLGTHATSISPTAAHGTPSAVRAALRRSSPHAAGIDLAALRLADAGDAADPDGDERAAAALVARAAARARLVLAIGGDNAATVPAARGAWGERIGTAGLITIDAHHDLRDGRSNGSPVRRLLEAGLDGRRVVQVGIQDFANSDAYARRAADAGITVIRRDACEEAPMREIASRAIAIAAAAGGPVHVDVDVDACDRAAAPGCPASLPGGLSAWQLRQLVRALASAPEVTSIDFTEVDASADTPDGRTVRLVAVCVLEALAGLASRSAASAT